MTLLRHTLNSAFIAALSVGVSTVQAGCGTWITNPDAGPSPKGGGKVSVNVETEQNGAGQSGTQPKYGTTDKNGASAGAVALTDGALVIGEMAFKSMAGRSGDVTFAGPYLINLMTGSIAPDLQGTLPEGQYHVVEGKLKRVGGSDVSKLGVSKQMEGFSTLISGSYDDGKGNVKTVLVRFDFDGVFALTEASSDPVVMTNGGQLDLAINLNVDSWFNFSGSSVDFSSVTASAIQLDKNSAGVEAQLYEIVKANFTKAVQFQKKGKGSPKVPAP